MNNQKLYEQMEQEILDFANKYSLTRLRTSTLNFDREWRRAEDGSFNLVSEKAVIRTMGKTTKVPLGEDEEHQTYEQAREATYEYWSEYYKDIRANRSDEQKRKEAQRQKRYRERRKEKQKELDRQQ